jgi:release factor glutamine methyltransferase
MSEDELFLTHILECTRVDLLINKPTLNPSQEKKFEEFRARRAKGEPLQYILGKWDFCGLEFNVDPRVLVPRPETEVMVEAAIKRFKGRDILDLGTGSGNIAVALAHFLPYSQVTTVDISIEAIVVAMANAQRHGVESRIQFISSDMTDYLQDSHGKFDLIISNPPYITTLQMKYLPIDVKREPALALDGGIDGLDFYRGIIKYSPPLLRKGGCLMMEFGDGQGGQIQSLARSSFSKIEVLKDLAGKDRIIICNN